MEATRDFEGQSGERRYYARPKICQFCADKNLHIDYKLADMLRRYVTEGKMPAPGRHLSRAARAGTAISARDTLLSYPT
jgi:small subunit ribosomal protein S18